MSVQLPYHTESRKFARDLAKDKKTDYEKYRTITDWVSRNIRYDFIRALTVPKRNGTPDLDGCWKKRMGICMDTAALATGMLQAVGLDATLCYGHAGRQYHAWVEVKIGKGTYRYDHDGTAKSYTVERTFRG